VVASCGLVGLVLVILFIFCLAGLVLLVIRRLYHPFVPPLADHSLSARLPPVCREDVGQTGIYVVPVGPATPSPTQVFTSKR